MTLSGMPQTAPRTRKRQRRRHPTSCRSGCLSSSSSSFSAVLLLVLVLVCTILLTDSPVVHAQPQPQRRPLESSSSSVSPAAGPIDELIVTCNMEDLEQANDSQLYTILHDLKQTAFFRTFRVDLSHKCPLRSWSTSSSTDKEASQETNDDDDQGDKDDDEEEEFDCPSNAFADLDEEAEPLCTVQPEEEQDDEDPASFLSSHALFTLSQDGFQSKEQQQTYTWDQHVDTVTTAASSQTQPGEDDRTTDKTESGPWTDPQTTSTTTTTTTPSDCDQDPVPHLLPHDFWLDLCTRVRNDDPTVVNLNLNPERNTGYNGTHIWTAIYEENCWAIAPTTDDDDQTKKNVCLEERVLYRLLSGLHASTTLSIAQNYYPPSKRKGRVDWEPNPSYFYQKFSPHPDHVRNLHFSYVVLLRALTKAASYLYPYEIRTGDVVQDEMATVLLRRLLDSSILQSCSSVFSAFDESLLFASEPSSGTHHANDFSLQHNFKDVFFNISSILDCVQCQQCKLHGKLAMLGYGTALKILFSPTNVLEDLTRNEIVALINTLAKFSESIRQVRELTHLYLLEQQQQQQQEQAPPQAWQSTTTSTTASSSSSSEPSAITSIATVDVAIGAIASLARQGMISAEREAQLVQWALRRHSDLLVLARHYGTADVAKFGHLIQFLDSTGSSSTSTTHEASPDAIVIGSGLAGMAATLRILDRGGSVILLEKEHLLGGNSNKASSGINACCPNNETTTTTSDHDSVDLFRNDTTRSAGSLARPDLIDVLVQHSASAVSWLRDRVGVDLSLLAQLGGHSARRTHRPSNGMAGAEIIYGMQKAIKAYIKSGKVTILTDSKVTSLLTEDEMGGDRPRRVIGVEYVPLEDKNNDDEDDDNKSSKKQLYANHVILATGGFAADRSAGSYLSQYRPELLKMPTTAGAFSTGDGIALATALGATPIDMDKVQVHPTGWVDPAEPDKKSKILAAELMRGVGGLLLNASGHRFCNELGTRAYVTNAMLSHNDDYARTSQWNIEADIPTFSLILSSSAALDGKKHVDLYTHKGLLTKLEGLKALAKWLNLPQTVVKETLRRYQEAAQSGEDQYGKTTFRGVPGTTVNGSSLPLDSEVFYAGTVTPVLHYCMGGITIDTQGHVLDESGQVIPGLMAAGEVTGGVHGANRLAGNSLLECTVYGSIVGQGIPIQSRQGSSSTLAAPTSLVSSMDGDSQPPHTDRIISPSELAQHNTPTDCWVAIHGKVYNLTSFAEEHPAGPASIHVLAGQDGSEAFEAVHNQGILEEVEEDLVGILGQDKDDDENETDTSTIGEDSPTEEDLAATDGAGEQTVDNKRPQEQDEPPKRGILAAFGWK